MKTKAVGIHVFAGGFTMGVQRVMDVVGQLEIHNFGRGTIEERLQLPFVNKSRWQEWNDHRDLWQDCRACYGNPRCTGFSCLTSGYSDAVHGPWAKATRDIHELCEFGTSNDFDFIVWESVQQAATVGRPMIDYLLEKFFAPKHYRVAHLFLNASTFGNSQSRKRYFFVAYKDSFVFNIEPPTLLEHHTTVRDVIGTPEMLLRAVNQVPFESKDDYTYDGDSCLKLRTSERNCVPGLRQGEDMNGLARHRPEQLKRLDRGMWQAWEYRASDMPFSMHCVRRLRWDYCMPTMFSSAGHCIHPGLDRPCTIRELAALMGWPDGVWPAGRDPVGQIAKGIAPSVGEWLAQQIQLSIDGAWGKDDWESSYDHKHGVWRGTDHTDSAVKPVEKTFKMTRYAPERPEKENICAETFTEA